MFKFIATGVMALAAVAGASPAAVAAPADDVPQGAVTVKLAGLNGSGCPRNSAFVDVSRDKKAFTITYSKFTAATGRKAGVADFRQNCQLALSVNTPAGFTWAIYSADYRGFASLSRGASGLQSANYYWQGSSDDQRSTHRLNGGFEGNWKFSDRAHAVSYLPCGQKRNLNVNQELRVTGGPSDRARKTASVMTMDSTDVDVSTVYNIAWRKC
jgi:hypothetical protein